MIIHLLIFSIIIFISPFIIFKLFKLNNFQGYLFGLLSFLAVIGLGFCLGFVVGIIIVILSIFMSQSTTFTVLIQIIYILRFASSKVIVSIPFRTSSFEHISNPLRQFITISMKCR